MGKWKNYPVTIRAAIVGAVLTIFGSLLVTFIVIILSNKKTASLNEEPTENTNSQINELRVNKDSLTLVEQVKNYFSFNAIQVNRLEKYDFHNDGIENEFFIEYQISEEDQISYYDVFTIQGLSLQNIYHDQFYAGAREYDYVKIKDQNFFIKTWQDMGSGDYLHLEIYKLSDNTKLSRIYEFPDTLNTYQGHYLRIGNAMYLKLATKRYLLEINPNNKVSLVAYTKRLQISDMQNSEHILRFDEIDNRLKTTFDNRILNFTKSNDKCDRKVTTDSIVLRLNEICWIDDNSVIPAGLRILSDSNDSIYESKYGLFDHLIAKKTGAFTIFINNNQYGDWYNIRFYITSDFKSLE